MEYRKLTLQDQKFCEQWFAQTDSALSCNDFVTVYGWNVSDTAEYAVWQGYLIIRIRLDDGRHFYYCPYPPKGASLAPVLQHIRDDEGNNGFIVSQIPLERAHELEGLTGYDEPMVDRNAFDYIYDTAALCTLSGKKYHSKRNFFHRFCAAYDYTYRDYTAADLDAVTALFDEWVGDGRSDETDRERTAFLRTVTALDALGARCGLLFVEDKLVAMSVVSVSVTGVGQVHYEKALTAYDGAYPAINTLTARTYLADATCINRQEDMGIEGLRKAKLSYHPSRMGEKLRLRAKH